MVFGNAELNICPYRLIGPKFDLPKLACKSNSSRTRRVMDALIEIAKSGNKIENFQDLTQLTSEAVLQYSLPLLIQRLYSSKGPPRPYEVNINTLANRMTPAK